MMKESFGRHFCICLLIAIALPGSAPAQDSKAWCTRIEKTTYRGWDAYKLTNGIVSLYLTPQIGGRNWVP